MGAWVKVFKDFTTEGGSDLEISKGRASWSKGRLKNIIRVFISEKLSSATLELPDTQWHQFDRMACIEGQTIRLFRVIQAKILEHHKGSYLCYANDKNSKKTYFSWCYLSDEPKSQNSLLIESSHIGKWISIQVSSNDSPVFFLADRSGEFNGAILK
jgi:hypothetical protein